MRRVFVDPASPQRDAIEEAAKWIVAGGVVVIPVRECYCLASRRFETDEARAAPPQRAEHAVGRAICREAGIVVAATVLADASADEIERRFADRVDLLIDVGTLEGGTPQWGGIYAWLQDGQSDRG